MPPAATPATAPVLPVPPAPKVKAKVAAIPAKATPSAPSLSTAPFKVEPCPALAKEVIEALRRERPVPNFDIKDEDGTPAASDEAERAYVEELRLWMGEKLKAGGEAIDLYDKCRGRTLPAT